MGLPHKLKNFRLFESGEDYIGLTSEITLPKIAEKVEGYRGGGMLAEVDIGMGLEKLEMEIKYGGAVRNKLRTLGRVGVAGTLLRFVGAYQEDVAGGVLAAELIAQGKLVELDPGNAKAGDNTEWTAKHTLSYLRWTLNGRTEVEIDVLNNVFLVDGVDRMAEIRAALQQ
ncbi:MAG: phage tail protein [Proteobacteria bacterium SG_bin5]|nr:phage major tail tube protein [Sphingomonas sp.]OQW42079.1 MAG: phage tail protein [Proteobacteria bacterium SG_bin5]